MFDDEQIKYLEEKLAEPLAENVQKRFFKRYWIWFSVFAVVAGYFGYDTYLNIRTYKEIAVALGDQLKPIVERVNDVEARLERAKEGLVNVEKLGDDINQATKDIEGIKSEISEITNRQFSFVVESAAGIYISADRPINAVDFFKQALKYANETKDHELRSFATLGLARAYSRLGVRDAARREFSAAEALARQQFESALPEQKRSAFSEYLNVLFTRAEDQEFLVNTETALLTLKNKALKVASEDGDPRDVGRVHARIADVYSSARDDAESLKRASSHYDDAVKFYHELTLDDETYELVARLHFNRADTYIALYEIGSDEEYARKAIEALERSIEYANAVGAHLQSYNSYTKISFVQFEMGDKPSAVNSICSAAKLGRRVNREPQAVISEFARVTDQNSNEYDYDALCE